MKPAKIRRRVQSQVKQVRDKETATKFFEQQKDALVGIRNTSGLQEIRDYFYRLYDESVDKLAKEDPKNIWKVATLQARITTARSFLSWVDNMTE